MFVIGRVIGPPKTRTASTTLSFSLSHSTIFIYTEFQRENIRKRESEELKQKKKLEKSISFDLFTKECKRVVSILRISPFIFFNLTWVLWVLYGMVVFFNLDLRIYQYFRAWGFSDLRFDGRIPITQLNNSGICVFLSSLLNPIGSHVSILQFHFWGLSVLLLVNGG